MAEMTLSSGAEPVRTPARGGGAKPFGPIERALAWRYLRARREHGGASLTAIISFIGITLAVTALIVIMSVMSGFRATLLNALLGGQPHIIVSVAQRPADESDLIARRIAEIPGIASARPYLENQVLASHEGVASSGAIVKSVTMAEVDSLDFLGDGEVARGAGFGEGRNGGKVVLMGAFLAQDLRLRPGDQVRLISTERNATPFGGTPRSSTYTLGATFKTGSVELDKVYIFMPMDQGQVFFQRQGQYHAIDVRLTDPMATEDALRDIGNAFGNSLYAIDWKSSRAQYLNALNVERSLMRIVMLVLITITSLNIITGVVMLVKNKTRDIAILRTIGASRGSMMRVFLMVGGLLGFAGAVTGLVLGVTIVLNIGAIEAFLNAVTGRNIFDPEVYGLEGLPAELNWGEAVFTTVWAVGMSVLVTLWPAWRGAALDPVEALRFE